MIVVKVEPHSAATGKVTEIGRMVIANDGTGSHDRGNYIARLMRRGTIDVVQKTAEVRDYARLSCPVWNLVKLCLESMKPASKKGRV